MNAGGQGCCSGRRWERLPSRRGRGSSRSGSHCATESRGRYLTRVVQSWEARVQAKEAGKGAAGGHNDPPRSDIIGGGPFASHPHARKRRAIETLHAAASLSSSSVILRWLTWTTRIASHSGSHSTSPLSSSRPRNPYRPGGRRWRSGWARGRGCRCHQDHRLLHFVEWSLWMAWMRREAGGGRCRWGGRERSRGRGRGRGWRGAERVKGREEVEVDGLKGERE